jgi:tetratricopeptide (TPR) repeat protein
MSTDPGATTLIDLSGESRLDTATSDPVLLAARAKVQMHLAIAARLLREGSTLQGFQELVRTTRLVPMNARLAAALVRMSVPSNTHTVAQLLISERLDDALGDERLDVQRQLVRLARKTNDLEAAQEQVSIILAERPTDRRARAVLNALLERGRRWEELDASLEKETREAARKSHYKTASRAALRRARLWSETLNDPARAALRAMQAAQFSEQAKDAHGAFLLRLLWLRNLHRAKAPVRALEEAAKVVLSMGERVGQAESARSLVEELGLIARSAGAPVRGFPETTDPGEHTVNSVETTPVVTSTIEPPSSEFAGPIPTAQPRRRSTQLELVAVAEVAAQAGKGAEAAAILAAAVREGPDPRAAQKLESHLIRRGAWRELAAFYRDAMDRAQNRADKAQWAEKLAELLESELNDSEGAARAWAEVAAATGDSRAVSEQVRLLNSKKDNTGVREALDAGVKQAQGGSERARAHVLRAEEALTRQQVAAARGDFEAALRLAPGFPTAAAGLAELLALQGETAPIRQLEEALARVPKRSPGRGDLYRRLARLADSPQRDAKLSRMAWNEVAAELPGDEEATTRLLALTRASGDDVALEALITAALGREPRGPKARLFRMELVMLLERTGREAESLEALKQAVRFEPGHRDSWLALAERLISAGRDNEAAWALEHAATATDDPAQRLRAWERLAQFVREQLGDVKRAETYEKRVERMQKEGLVAVPGSAPSPSRAGPGELPGGPLVIPPRRAIRARVPVLFQNPQKEVFDKAAEKAGFQVEPHEPSRAHVRVAARVARQLTGFVGEPLLTPRPPPPVPDDPVEVSSLEALEPFDDPSEPGAPTREIPAAGSDTDEDDVTPGPAAPAIDFEEQPSDVEELGSDALELPDDPIRRTAELKVELGDPAQAIAPSFGPSPARALSGERQALFERVRANPLEVDGYKLLAEHFDTANDPARSSLMLEIARALEGDPHAAPRAPRLILNATDRVGLKHPSLRGEGGELLGLVGVALCRLNPSRGKEAGTDDEFHLDAGKGARGVADALLASVRILGLRSPDVYLSEDPGPPISLVFTDEPRLIIGKLAVKKEVTDAELRFFAGRALFTLQPELMALRNLRRDQLLRGIVLVSQVAEGRGSPAETKHFRDAVPERSWERLRQLVRKMGPRLDLSALSEGARHSVNRAGLVVCGGIAPAIASLRAKKALPSEMTELIRFAASERYLQLRNRNLPRR